MLCGLEMVMALELVCDLFLSVFRLPFLRFCIKLGLGGILELIYINKYLTLKYLLED